MSHDAIQRRTPDTAPPKPIGRAKVITPAAAAVAALPTEAATVPARSAAQPPNAPRDLNQSSVVASPVRLIDERGQRRNAASKTFYFRDERQLAELEEVLRAYPSSSASSIMQQLLTAFLTAYSSAAKSTEHRTVDVTLRMFL